MPETRLDGFRLSSEDDLAIDRELCKRSLSEFVKMAWHVIEPGNEYVHGWHIDAICEHLEAVSRGQINRLLINCPPGVMKSLLVSVFWPMWEWGPLGRPYTRIIGSSHSQSLAVRDNIRSRRIVFSNWFQERWPIYLTADQDTKLKFENDQTGFRAAMAANSMIGERGDRVILDDPHSVESAFSAQERENTTRWFKETVPTRTNSPEKSAIIVIMQRLHQRDVSGVIIEDELGYEHLMLPMEFEKDRRCTTSIGFTDPRTEEGELLFPQRFPKDVIDRDVKAMGGPTISAGQFQQRPAPRGGAMIPFRKLNTVSGCKETTRHAEPVPKVFNRVVRYWDKAGTEGGGKRTAGVKIGIDSKKRIWILDVVKGQWGAVHREEHILATAKYDGVLTHQWVEQEPGSGGKESAEGTIRNLLGFVIQAERPTGDKVLRAEPFAVQVEAGNVYLAPGEWNEDYVGECELFPVGRFKDQIDATSGALSKCVSNDVERLEAMCKS